MSDQALSDEEVAARLSEVPGWTFEGGRLQRTFTFGNFVEAFGFMARVALVAEKLDHHPDWSNSWNTVEVAVMSHQAGGVTDRCFALVAQINKVA